MNITVHAYLLERRKKPNGEYPIYVRITENLKYSLVSMKVSVSKAQWDDKKRRVKKHDRMKVINSRIERIEATAQEYISKAELNSKKITRFDVVELVKTLMNRAHTKQLEDVFEEYAFLLQARGSYHRPNQVRYACHRLMELNQGTIENFEQVTAETINQFQTHLQTKYKNHNNTVRKYVGILKAVFRYANKHNYTSNDPFAGKGVEVLKGKQSKVDVLTDIQIQTIEDLQLEYGSDLWHTRNYFLFALYCAGIRFGDVATLEWSHVIDGRIKYNANKTEKETGIIIIPKAQRILDLYKKDFRTGTRYVFPLIKSDTYEGADLKKKIHSANAIINRNLKDIQRMAGIETNITTHLARHSFANRALNKDMSLKAIQELLNHTSIRTTEIYAKSLPSSKIDKAHKDLFEDN